NSYFIPNVKATAYCCRTNLPPNTAFRGFGGPQGMFVIESAIAKAAEEMGINKIDLQKKNLLKDGDEFPYGQKTEHCRIKRCFTEAEKKYDLKKMQRSVLSFNSKNILFKKGLAVMPVTFGISFTSTFMNQASALVHIYTDGSISVSTAAVEMGQGVNEKIRNVVQNVFSVNLKRIKIETTNTSRVANTSPTAASKAADLNGFATKKACEIILERLKKAAAKELNVKQYQNITIQKEYIYNKKNKTKLTFDKLIQIAYLNRISLSAQAHHSTPNIHFDKSKEKGQPFAYHSYGVGIVEATVDCIRGTYEIDSVKVVHDFGKSLQPIVDKGQAEGGIVQGIGWMTMEEVLYSKEGQLLANALSTYKVPDIHFAPTDIQVLFLEDAPNPYGPYKSKAIGEPPLMYGIGAYFAIRNAIKEFKPEKNLQFKAPMTPEYVLLSLYKI
ncbi:MAG: xanthine dehydrogenase, partial [Ignavibacteriales bacterium CG_4_9_14_3_um_filter_30_11]